MKIRKKKKKKPTTATATRSAGGSNAGRWTLGGVGVASSHPQAPLPGLLLSARHDRVIDRRAAGVVG